MPVLASLNRVFREGVVYSAEATVPAQVSGQAVTVTADLSDEDLVDPTLAFTIGLWWFDSTITDWRLYVRLGWQGFVDNADRPSVSLDGTLLAGRRVRCELVVPTRMRLGLSVSLDPL